MFNQFSFAKSDMFCSIPCKFCICWRKWNVSNWFLMSLKHLNIIHVRLPIFDISTMIPCYHPSIIMRPLQKQKRDWIVRREITGIIIFTIDDILIIIYFVPSLLKGVPTFDTAFLTIRRIAWIFSCLFFSLLSRGLREI